MSHFFISINDSRFREVSRPAGAVSVISISSAAAADGDDERSAHDAPRVGGGSEERSKGGTEPVRDRAVLRRLLDAFVHAQLHPGLSSRPGAAQDRAGHLHRADAPQLCRKPNPLRLPPERLQGSST